MQKDNFVIYGVVSKKISHLLSTDFVSTGVFIEHSSAHFFRMELIQILGKGYNKNSKMYVQ